MLKTKAVLFYLSTGETIFLHVAVDVALFKSPRSSFSPSPDLPLPDFADDVSFSYSADLGTLNGLLIAGVEHTFHLGEKVQRPVSIMKIETIGYRVKLGGDLLYIAAITGREGASPHWCMLCELMRKEWQLVWAKGPAWTVAKLEEQREALFRKVKVGGVPHSSLSLEKRNAVCKAVGSARKGLRIGEACLFACVELTDYAMSVLHIILGLVSELWKRKKKDVILKIQVNPPKVQAAYEAVDTTEELLEVAQIAFSGVLGEAARMDHSAVVAKWQDEFSDLTTRFERYDPRDTKEPLEKDALKTKASAAENKLKKARAELEEQNKQVSEAEKVVLAAKTKHAASEKTLKELLEKRMSAGECEELMRDVLGEFNITQDAHFGGSFTGNNCGRIVDHIAAICDKLRRGFRKICKAGVTDKIIDDLLFPYERLLTQFSICYTVMRSTDEQTDDAIEAFRVGALRFGEMWRKYFGPNPLVAPKLHALEVHCVEQLLEFGCLGILSEDPIEVLHHLFLVQSRIVSNFRDYEKREQYLYSRQAAMKSAVVVEILGGVAAGRKRNFGAASLERRKLQQTEDDKRLAVKIEKVDLFLSKMSYDVIEIFD